MNDTASVKLFHPTGAPVSIPLDMEHLISLNEAEILSLSINNLIQAGFLVEAPDLDATGEDEVNAVARRSGPDDVPIIDFYSSNVRLTKKVMHVYLNNAEEISAFEMATGLQLDAIPVFDGQIAIQRDNKNAAKYIKPLACPIKLFWKLSPKWQEWNKGDREGQEPHKRLLVRYGTAGAPPPRPNAQPAMTLDQANETLTPGKKMMFSLTNEQLALLSTSQANNVTAEMRAAANLILAERKKES
jgi:hypothetical protein